MLREIFTCVDKNLYKSIMCVSPFVRATWMWLFFSIYTFSQKIHKDFMVTKFFVFLEIFLAFTCRSYAGEIDDLKNSIMIYFIDVCMEIDEVKSFESGYIDEGEYKYLCGVRDTLGFVVRLCEIIKNNNVDN